MSNPVIRVLKPTIVRTPRGARWAAVAFIWLTRAMSSRAVPAAKP